MKKLLILASVVVMSPLASTAEANLLSGNGLKPVYEKHGRGEEEVRGLVKEFFGNLVRDGYKVKYTLDPERNRAIFKAEYSHWFAGTIKITGTVTWDDRGLWIHPRANKYQSKVESRIREFLLDVLKK